MDDFSSAAFPPSKSPVLRVYRQIQPDEGEDLVNTIQQIFEQDADVRDNGIILLDAPHLISPPGNIVLPPKNFAFEATGQKISIPSKFKGKGIVQIGCYKDRLPTRKPLFEPTKDLTAENIEDLFQEMMSTAQKYPYFNIDLRYNHCRKDSYKLFCGSPMNGLSYIAGVNTPFAYYSPGKSHFGAHIEDWYFSSYNINFAGAIKLWIAVKPSSKDIFEREFRKLFPKTGNCVQFIRHLGINIAPSLLRQWDVEHYVVPQRPGQVVAVTGYTYHWGINTGQNYAEAINFCLEKEWVAREDFRNCDDNCGNAAPPLPTPIAEEGTMEEKALRADKLSIIRHKEWIIERKRLKKKQAATMKARKETTTLRIRASRYKLKNPAKLSAHSASLASLRKPTSRPRSSPSLRSKTLASEMMSPSTGIANTNTNAHISDGPVLIELPASNDSSASK